jgi:hypothetical protein
MPKYKVTNKQRMQLKYEPYTIEIDFPGTEEELRLELIESNKEYFLDLPYEELHAIMYELLNNENFNKYFDDQNIVEVIE